MDFGVNRSVDTNMQYLEALFRNREKDITCYVLCELI